MASVKQSADAQLADTIADFYADPLGYVMFNWDWNNDTSIQLVKLAEPWKSRYGCEYGPDVWACEFLDQLGRDIKARGFNGKDPVEPIMYSTASGHGIGKSVMVAWLIKFVIDTRPSCKGTVTANTDIQLRTKTWATLGEWHAKSLTAHWADYSAGRGSMALKSKYLGGVVTAQTSREENSESFAGQHAANSTSFYIFDEASGIGENIFEVRKGGLMTGEPMVFDFGNPTRNTGAFYENCVGSQKHRYTVRMIDARSVAITNKKEQQKMVDDFGIDSDIVKVRVLGQFPAQGSTQFIGGDQVGDAMVRPLPPLNRDPIVLGVDVARFGDDDSVIYTRQGMDARSWFSEKDRYKGIDTVQLTGKVIEKIRFFRNLGHRVAMIFVDGGGIGGGVVDQLRHLGYPVTEVNFGGKPTDTNTYRYKVDEMWGKVRDALGTRLCLPQDQGAGSPGRELKEQLLSRQFGYTTNGQKINLESKAELKERGYSSPDIADGLALTFAAEVAPGNANDFAGHNVNEKPNIDYNPLEGRL
jgi:hypothetical protein